MDNFEEPVSSNRFMDIVKKPINMGFFNVPLWSILLAIIIVVLMLCKLGIFDGLFEGVKKMTGGAENENENKNKINTTTKLYNFNTSWCGHSVNFQSVWDEFSTETNLIGNLEALDVKCDNEDGDAICDEYKVKVFPTIILEKYNENGDPIRTLYEGDRSIESLRDFRDSNIN